MQKRIAILWLRQDLRIDDNPALNAACNYGEVLPVYIYDEDEEGDWPPGGATKWWLHHSLVSLENDLKKSHLPLIIRKGAALSVLNELIAQTGATAVYWNRRYEPSSIERDTAVKRELIDSGIDAQSFNAALLYEPWTIANKQGKPYQVFTPFWKACQDKSTPAAPVPKPATAHAPKQHPASLPVKELKLLPAIPWDSGFKEQWEPGTQGALKQLKNFIRHADRYLDERDFPAIDGISLLSPHLHFGEISPRTIWKSVSEAYQGRIGTVECYLRQLGWREFAHHLLYHFPETPLQPLRKDFHSFPWRKSAKDLKAWQKGLTGYPFVDAGMRQLWHIGWMHNRVRMVVGSFLVKNLLISWTHGARWFWDTLVDADLANNTLGWQWVGGCGADAAPYFRIFNPISQGEKFDPEGEYIRKWIPELARLPAKWIHRPWEAPPLILKEAGIALGKDYPYPIVDHSKARESALAAFHSLTR